MKKAIANKTFLLFSNLSKPTVPSTTLWNRTTTGPCSTKLAAFPPNTVRLSKLTTIPTRTQLLDNYSPPICPLNLPNSPTNSVITNSYPSSRPSKTNPKCPLLTSLSAKSPTRLPCAKDYHTTKDSSSEISEILT